VMYRFKAFAWGVAVVLSLSIFAVAQTGSIQGTVMDQSGAVVSGAEITVRNLATNQSRVVTSGGTGAYSIPDLVPGTYEVAIKKESFKVFKVSDLVVTVAQLSTVNARLEPGAVTEELQVRADQLPPVDLETPQISNLVDSREIKDLPLITRDPYSLILLSPGTSQTTSYLGGFTVNGSRERNNNFLLDGVDNNDTSVPGSSGGALTLNPDSVQEFRVITDNFNAEYGRNTGAIIDIVTKSGTNNFHGNAYEFGRWNSFGGARDYFNRAADPNTGEAQPMDPYIRNQFGYSFGGPIIKDKTFFFVNQEFQRFITTLTSSVNAPTAAFKTGKFTYLGQAIDLTDTGANNAYGLPLDPTAQKLLALYPTPTSSADGLQGVVFFPTSSRQSSWQATGKIDHKITDNHSLNVRYSYDYFKDPDPSHDESLPGGIGATAEKSLNQGLGVGLTSTLSSNLINDFRFGWNRIYAAFDCSNQQAIDAISGVDRFGNGADYYIAPFNNGSGGIGCISLVSNGQWRKTGTTSFSDAVSWVKGSHTFKFGFDFRDIGEQGPNSFFSRRQVDTRAYSQTVTSLINPPANDSTALEDAASALYGFVWNDLTGEFFDKNGVRQGSDNKHFRQHEFDWFGQDTWKLYPNFTLSLGLRYQLDGVPYEENANFSNLLTSPAAFPVVFSIVGPGTGKSIYQPDYSNIEPRIGFSWDPWKDGKTAVRAAFGMFHDRVFGNLFGNARGNPPFEQDFSNFPFDTINNAFGTGAFPATVPDTTPSAVVPDGSLISPVVFDTHYRNSLSNNWNAGIQRELPGGNTLDLSYVGTKGTYIYRQMDGNPPDPTLVNQLVAYCTNNPNVCSPDQVQLGNLYYGHDFGPFPFNAVAHNALYQPAYQRSSGSSIYNALQLKVTHPLRHGLQVQGSYTWAHGIDDASDPLAPAAGNRTFPRNSRNPEGDRGNSDNDIRHILSINYIWELPIGRGRTFANSGTLGRILEGMQFSGLTAIQGGHPFEIRCTTDSQRSGIGQWCSQNGQDPFAAGVNTAANQDQRVYFGNPGAFVEPAFGGPGSIGRNQFYGPGYVNFDLSFAKKQQLTERFLLEFRVECYNIFNHPHFQQPDNLIASPTFGLISDTYIRADGTTSNRQMQAALKLSF